ncbi:MAG TPA: radical SAM protein, partial [Thermodesulfovibrionales bacterium]|nr:radical SAM protein [Thermodesulfovibrionales bacterium]
MTGYCRLSPEALQQKLVEAERLLKNCALCPRKCGVDRTAGETGYCGVLDRPSAASWGPHFGEEKPLVGRFGSGTIFFSRCNLGCVFCQNWTISHASEGVQISADRLARVMLDLQDEGCHNINLVTPTHQMPMILRSLIMAKDRGLNLPIVYNCGGYESLEALAILEGIVDVYMPDFKYGNSRTAATYSDAEGYTEHAKAALKEMHRQVGDLVLDERGLAVKGLLVRHLILPENLAGTEDVVRFIAKEISLNTYMNLMDQYHPCYRAHEYPPLDRRLTRKEYKTAI